MATENNTTFVAGTQSFLGKELEFITIDAGEELANHLLKNETANAIENTVRQYGNICLLYTSPSPRDLSTSRMPSSA